MTTLDDWAKQATPTLIEFAWQEMESRWRWRGKRTANAKDQGHSALHVAATLPGTYLPFLAHLLKEGADTATLNPEGKSALFPAIWQGEVKSEVISTTVARMQILLEGGADPNMPDNKGISPLMEALHQSPGAVPCLLKAGARVDWVSRAPLFFQGPRHTPLEIAQAWLEMGDTKQGAELQALLFEYGLPSPHPGKTVPARRL
jgi:hypothetical protein